MNHQVILITLQRVLWEMDSTTNLTWSTVEALCIQNQLLTRFDPRAMETAIHG